MWRYDIGPSSPADLEADLRLLSPEAAARAARFRRPIDRQRYVRGQAGLCRILGRLLGRPPEEIVISRTALGQPRLAAAPAVSFSLTHAGDIAAVAVSQRCAVGLDIEPRTQPLEDPAALAASAMTAAEQAFIAAPADDGARRTRFLQLWVAKEAAVKCLGTGFLLDPRTIELALANDQAAGITRPERAATIRLTPFDLTPDVLACLAVDAATGPGAHAETRP